MRGQPGVWLPGVILLPAGSGAGDAQVFEGVKEDEAATWLQVVTPLPMLGYGGMGWVLWACTNTLPLVSCLFLH